MLAARRLRWIVIAAMVIMTALYVAGRLGLQVGQARIEYRGHGPDLAVTRLLADISIALLLVALCRLTQMLGRIAVGDLFSADVVGRFRSFAFWLLLMALLGVLSPIAGALLGPPAAPRQVHFAINFREIITVGVTLVLFLLARLLERARAIDEEVREFV